MKRTFFIAGHFFLFLLFSAFALYAQTTEVLMKQAVDAIGRQDYPSAVSILEKAIAADPKNDEAYARRAFCYMAQVEYKTDPRIGLARADVEKALQINPKQPLALGVRGFLKSTDKDYDGAFADYEASLKINPNEKWIKTQLEKVVRESPNRLGKIKADALAKLPDAKKKLEANIWNYQSYLELDKIFSAADRFGNDKLARTYWENLIVSNPKNICAVKFLGAYKNGANWRDKTVFLENGLNRYDGKNGAECAAEIAFEIGREYQDHQQFDVANTYYNRARQLNPKSKVQFFIEANLAKKESEQREKEALEKQIAANSRPLNNADRQKQLDDKLEKYRSDSKNRDESIEKAGREIEAHWENFNRLVKTFNELPSQTRADAVKVQAELKSIKQICEDMLAKYEKVMSARYLTYFRDEKAAAENHIVKLDEILRQMQ